MDEKELELQRQKEAIGEMRSVQRSHLKSSQKTSGKENSKFYIFLIYLNIFEYIYI